MNSSFDYFESFWSLYPRKIAKVIAQKASQRIDSSEWPAIMEGLQKQLPGFRERIISGEKQFIPHASTWLNQRRWEDEVDGQEDTKEIDLYQFIKAVATSNGTMPMELSPTIKQAFFRMKIPWGQLKQIKEDELKSLFLKALENKTIVDFKSAAAGERE